MAAPARPVADDEIDLREYLRALTRRIWLIVAIVGAAAVASILVTRVATPIFEATTTILIRPSNAGLAVQEGPAALLLGQRPSMQNYVELLKSRAVAERVAQQVLGAGAEPPSPEQVARIQEAVTIQALANTDAVQIRVRLPDPAEAQQVANAMVDVFTEVSQEMNRLEARAALAFVQEQLVQVQEKLSTAEGALLAYRERQRVVEPLQQARAAVDKVAELEKMRATVQIGLQEAATRIAQVRSQLRQQVPTLITSTTIATNPVVQSLRQRITEVEAQLSAVRENYGPSHPQVTALEAQAKELQRILTQEVERVVSAQTESLNPIHQGLVQELIGLEVDQIAQQARLSAIERMISAEETLLMELPSREMELARLERERQVNEQIYVMLRTRFEELRIQEATVTSDVRVIDPARLPTVPVSPRPLLNLAVAVFMGLFVGVGVALVLELLNTSVRNEEELESLLGAPVLGRIPHFPEAEVERLRGAANGQ